MPDKTARESREMVEVEKRQDGVWRCSSCTREREDSGEEEEEERGRGGGERNNLSRCSANAKEDEAL
uniref:Uncharacterized protein n=1 Tax=Knipowitschia caucasica TaxID=637954 RepID=A0AAV2L1Z6_KNICA